MPTIIRRRPPRIRMRRFLPSLAGGGPGPSGHRVIVQGLGSLFLLTQGYECAAAPSLGGGLITQGLGTGLLVTQGYSTATVAAQAVVLQGLGTGRLITQGYGAP